MNNTDASLIDIAVIGAGAAGLAAAIFAAETAQKSGASLRIVLIDGARKPGAKILVSGGGRCNVTNGAVTADDYCGGSSKIIRNVLRSFDENRTVAWMESLGVPLKLESTGKYFPVADSARAVLSALMSRVSELGVETRFGFRVQDLRDSPDGWSIINAADGSALRARRVVVATGGRALPKSGSDGAAYPWLERLGHTIIPTVPALAPLILDERGLPGSPLSHHFAELSGITIDATLTFVVDHAAIATFTASTLFTHFGLSGPAPMNLSRHIARYRQENPGHAPGRLLLGIPGMTEPNLRAPQAHGAADAWLLDAIKASPRASVVAALARLLPERIAGCIASVTQAQRLADVTKKDRLHLAELLAASPLAVKGDRGYSFAEATAGGVALDEINWRDMRSRKADNLYLCGEILDVDGRIGGFNFQWAWAGGYLAGRAAAG